MRWPFGLRSASNDRPTTNTIPASQRVSGLLNGFKDAFYVAGQDGIPLTKRERLAKPYEGLRKAFHVVDADGIPVTKRERLVKPFEGVKNAFYVVDAEKQNVSTTSPIHGCDDTKFVEACESPSESIKACEKLPTPDPTKSVEACESLPIPESTTFKTFDHDKTSQQLILHPSLSSSNKSASFRTRKFNRISDLVSQSPIRIVPIPTHGRNFSGDTLVAISPRSPNQFRISSIPFTPHHADTVSCKQESTSPMSAIMSPTSAIMGVKSTLLQRRACYRKRGERRRNQKVIALEMKAANEELSKKMAKVNEAHQFELAQARGLFQDQIKKERHEHTVLMERKETEFTAQIQGIKVCQFNLRQQDRDDHNITASKLGESNDRAWKRTECLEKELQAIASERDALKAIIADKEAAEVLSKHIAESQQSIGKVQELEKELESARGIIYDNLVPKCQAYQAKIDSMENPACQCQDIPKLREENVSLHGALNMSRNNYLNVVQYLRLVDQARIEALYELDVCQKVGKEMHERLQYIQRSLEDSPTVRAQFDEHIKQLNGMLETVKGNLQERDDALQREKTEHQLTRNILDRQMNVVIDSRIRLEHDNKMIVQDNQKLHVENDRLIHMLQSGVMSRHEVDEAMGTRYQLVKAARDELQCRVSGHEQEKLEKGYTVAALECKVIVLEHTLTTERKSLGEALKEAEAKCSKLEFDQETKIIDDEMVAEMVANQAEIASSQPVNDVRGLVGSEVLVAKDEHIKTILQILELTFYRMYQLELYLHWCGKFSFDEEHMNIKQLVSQYLVIDEDALVQRFNAEFCPQQSEDDQTNLENVYQTYDEEEGTHEEHEEHQTQAQAPSPLFAISSSTPSPYSVNFDDIQPGSDLAAPQDTQDHHNIPRQTAEPIIPSTSTSPEDSTTPSPTTTQATTSPEQEQEQSQSETPLTKDRRKFAEKEARLMKNHGLTFEEDGIHIRAGNATSSPTPLVSNEQHPLEAEVPALKTGGTSGISRHDWQYANSEISQVFAPARQCRIQVLHQALLLPFPPPPPPSSPPAPAPSPPPQSSSHTVPDEDRSVAPAAAAPLAAAPSAPQRRQPARGAMAPTAAFPTSGAARELTKDEKRKKRKVKREQAKVTREAARAGKKAEGG